MSKLKIQRKKSKKRSKKRSTTRDPLKTAQERLKDLEAKREAKLDMKNVAVGTSKTNYIDPRIIVAFAKKHGIKLDKVFNKTQRTKFEWAEYVSKDWEF